MRGLFKMECVLCPLLSALLVLLSSSPECNGQDTVKQAAGEDRKDGDSPKYMMVLIRGGGSFHSTEFDGSKFGAELVGNSFSLKMEAVDVTDSAVYYCALQPTLTGNTNTLDKNLCSKDNTIVQCLH
uniref:Immunoglobulin V-set domain-containing protein n=1 Tax=Knipowitschia caucasica TaxID=637954 RepID=A0AAV2JZC0_KNICA